MAVGFEEKIWGNVLHVFHSDHAAVSCLNVRAGYRCSTHYHLHRVNQFTVMSGSVLIEEFPDGPGGRVVKTLLGKGQTHTIIPPIIHRFRVMESGCMVEVYWPDDLNVDFRMNSQPVRLDDIVRLDVGGADLEGTI